MPVTCCERIGAIGNISCILLGTLLFVVSFGDVCWLEGHVLQTDVRVGLWRICWSKDGGLDNNMTMNHTSKTHGCSTVFDQSFGRVLFTGPGWYLICCALSFFALLSSLTSSLATVDYAIEPNLENLGKSTRYVILTVMCLIPTCLMYAFSGHHLYTDRYVTGNLRRGYSFQVGCVSVVFFVLATFFFLIPFWMMLERTREQDGPLQEVQETRES